MPDPSDQAPPVITRFAPSPTGHLHIGGVRTALFCWAYAKHFGGRFILRVEDTDQARSSEASARGILEDLAWCGIEWDEGPELIVQTPDSTAEEPRTRTIGGDPRGVGSFYQSQRLPLYNQIINDMIERDLAYPAFDTAAEMEAQRKAAAERKETFRYKRSPNFDRATALTRMRAGEPCVIRFNNPGKVVNVVDEVLGTIKFEPEHTDDFVLRKADGFPTYHFAVVVDDQTMGVTHILRGQEHLNNTPRHVALQLALGYRVPKFAHLPLIFNPDSTKMSKRDKDKAAREAVKKQAITSASLGKGILGDVTDEQFDQWLGDKTRQLPSDVLRRVALRTNITLPEIDVDDFRTSGYLPDVLCNYVALLGWNPGMKTPDGKDLEKFDRAFLAQHFDFDRVGKTNSKFDRVKLASFNQDAIAPPPVGPMSDSQFAQLWMLWCASYEPRVITSVMTRALPGEGHKRFEILASCVRARAKTMREAVAAAWFVLVDDSEIVFDTKAVEKALKKPLPAPMEGSTGLTLLAAARATLNELPDREFDPKPIHDALEALAAKLGIQIGPIAQGLRVALTGTGVSPGIGETLASLGKTSSLSRIDRCLSVCV